MYVKLITNLKLLPTLSVKPTILNSFVTYKMPFGASGASSPLDTCINKLYELRLYKFEPQYASKFKKLTSENIHLRTAHSRLLGYWFTEFGTLNRVIHLWEYDSYNQRACVRKALAEDGQWMKFVNIMKPLLTKEKNLSMRKLSDELCVTTPGEQGGDVHYRLNVIVVKEPIDANAMKFKELSAKAFEIFAKAGVTSVQHISTFLSDSGKMNEIIQFVRFTNADDITMHKVSDSKEMQDLRVQMGEVAVLGNSQVLVPADFSPLK